MVLQGSVENLAICRSISCNFTAFHSLRSGFLAILFLLAPTLSIVYVVFLRFSRQTTESDVFLHFTEHMALQISCLLPSVTLRRSKEEFDHSLANDGQASVRQIIKPGIVVHTSILWHEAVY